MTRPAAELHAEALASGHPCDCPACAPELYRGDGRPDMPLAFRYAYASHDLWDAVIPVPLITRRCKQCGLVEIRGYYEGAEFVPLNRPAKPCRHVQAEGRGW